MIRKSLFMLAVIVGFILMHSVIFAAEPFYAGKTVRIIIGYSPGGGYDIYTRAIGRHMGKHIPGNPTVIVDNMPGAMGLVSANHIYKAAKPDGLTIGHFSGTLFLYKLMGQPGVEFDPLKFVYLGAYTREHPVACFTKASGITSIEKWRASKVPAKMGSTGLGVTFSILPRILQETLGVPAQVVSGYKGSAEILLAAESGELFGGAWAWEAFRTVRRSALGTDWFIVVQAAPKPDPDLPNIPLAINLVQTDEARRLIQLGIHDICRISRVLVLPPGTPKEQVEILRKAFMETLKDKEFLAEAEKALMIINPVTAEELEATIAGFFRLDSAMVTKLKRIFFE